MTLHASGEAAKKAFEMAFIELIAIWVAFRQIYGKFSAVWNDQRKGWNMKVNRDENISIRQTRVASVLNEARLAQLDGYKPQ